MHVWAIARARATIGGPSFDSRTPSRNALFQRSTTLSRGAADARLATTAEAGTPDRSSAAPPAAAAVRKSRRDTARFNAMAPRSTSFEAVRTRVSSRVFDGGPWVAPREEGGTERLPRSPAGALLEDVEERAVR